MPTRKNPVASGAAEGRARAGAEAGAEAGAGAKAGAKAGAEGTARRVLKKYPNRRLYDTKTSGYITLADVKQMVLQFEDFEVLDAKTSEDLTRSILLQIILEEESGGVPMFSTETLSQIIRFYGHAMQGMMGAMIEKNLQAFAQMQTQFVQQGKELYDPKHLSPEVWTRFLGAQPNALQGLMGSYMEQSKALFEQMQQAGSLFPGMGVFPGGKK